MDEERWRPIDGHPGAEVSDRGNLRGGESEVPPEVGHSRLRVGLVRRADPGTPPDKGRWFRRQCLGTDHVCVARLVYGAFVGRVPNGTDVAPRNGDRRDCSAANLVARLRATGQEMRAPVNAGSPRPRGGAG